MVVIALGDKSDYNQIIAKITKSLKGNAFGQMYYIPRIRIVVKEDVCDYFVWKNQRDVRFLVLPAFYQLTNELTAIANACVAKLDGSALKYTVVLNPDTCYVKFGKDVRVDIPPHRCIRFCIGVYGLYVADNKAYLQFELVDWKVDASDRCLL